MMTGFEVPGVLERATIDNVPAREWHARQLIRGLGIGLILAAGTKWYRAA